VNDGLRLAPILPTEFANLASYMFPIKGKGHEETFDCPSGED
jgi:hypothetical protein